MLLDFRRKKEQLAHCVTIADILTKEGDLSEIVAAVGQPERAKDESVASVDEDVVKDTKTISLDFFMDGLTIEEIAKKKRDMVAGTIYGHLIHFVGTDIDATDLIEEDKLKKIIDVIEQNEGKSSSELKMLLGDGFDYPDIKIGQRVVEMSAEKTSS